MTAVSPARRAPPDGGDGPPESPDAHGRFGLLLLVLITTYLLAAFTLSKVAESIEMVLFLAALLLALRTSQVTHRWRVLLVAVTVTGTLVAGAGQLSGTDTGIGLADLWRALMLLLAALIIVRRVLARPTVTIQSIYGAVSAYLIIGLMFAAIYSTISHLSGTPFFVNGEAANTQTFQYFSFTTLTTLGYGDFTAAGSGGRAIAVMEAVVGQIFLATLVARLVAAFRRPTDWSGLPGKVPPPGPARRRAPAARAAALTSRTPGRARRPGPGSRRPGPRRRRPRPDSRPLPPPG
jgi:hypothetical protein